MLLNLFLMGICLITHQAPNALWEEGAASLGELNSLLAFQSNSELSCCVSALKTISVQHPHASLLVFGCHKAQGMDPSWAASWHGNISRKILFC